MTDLTRADKQRERARSMRMTPELRARLESHAGNNGMSQSEAIREAMHHFVTGEVLVPRRQRSERVTFWVEPELYRDFVKAAEARGVTATDALEAALQDTT